MVYLQAHSRTLILSSIFLLIIINLPSPALTKFPNSNNWCFVRPQCNQDNPNSEWNKGLCKNGKAQSPIDFPAEYDPTPPENVTIDFSKARKNYDFTNFNVKNDGKYLELSKFRTSSGKRPTFRRNGSTYTLHEIDLHWGPENNAGSEHSIGGKRFAMEMQLIHYKTSGGVGGGYKNLVHAKLSGKPDAISSIAIFLEADDSAEKHYLDDVTSNLEKIAKKGSSAAVAGTKLKLSEILEGYTKALTYSGSMTIPKCREVVAWLVLQEPVKVKPECVKAFREKLLGFDKTPVSKNNRNIQESNNRPIGAIELKQ